MLTKYRYQAAGFGLAGSTLMLALQMLGSEVLGVALLPIVVLAGAVGFRPDLIAGKRILGVRFPALDASEPLKSPVPSLRFDKHEEGNEFYLRVTNLGETAAFRAVMEVVECNDFRDFDRTPDLCWRSEGREATIAKNGSKLILICGRDNDPTTGPTFDGRYDFCLYHYNPSTGRCEWLTRNVYGPKSEEGPFLAKVRVTVSTVDGRPILGRSQATIVCAAFNMFLLPDQS